MRIRTPQRVILQGRMDRLCRTELKSRDLNGNGPRDRLSVGNRHSSGVEQTSIFQTGLTVYKEGRKSDR